MGMYYLFVSYFSIFNLLGDGGLGVAAIKKIAEGKECEQYFTAYTVLRLILLIISTLIFLLIYSFLPNNELAAFVVIALIIACVMNIIKTQVISKDKITLSNTGAACGELLRIVFSVITVLIGFSLYGMIGGFLAGMILTGIICFKGFSFSFAKFNKKHVKVLCTFSLWAVLNSSAALIMGYADVLFIGFFMDSADVGVYRIVLALAALVIFISSAIITTLPPKISNWYENRENEKIESVTSKSITWSLCLGVPLVVGGSILGEKLLYYYYGAEFASGYNALLVLFAFYLMCIFSNLFGIVLVNSGNIKTVAIGTSISLIFNLVFNFLLIQSLGILGVALATLISQIFLFSWLLKDYRKLFKLNLQWANIIKIIFSSAVMGAAVIASGFITHYEGVIVTTLTVLGGAAIYFILMILLTKKFKTFDATA